MGNVLVTNVTLVPWDTERVLRRKTLGENSFFFQYWSLFFLNNKGTAQPLVCVVTAIKPMAAAELHSLWLESQPKPTRRMGGASGYIMWAFAKAPQVTSTEAMTESCSHIARQSTQYSFRISGNQGYVSNRVCYLYSYHSWCERGLSIYYI